MKKYVIALDQETTAAELSLSTMTVNVSVLSTKSLLSSFRLGWVEHDPYDICKVRWVRFSSL